MLRYFIFSVIAIVTFLTLPQLAYSEGKSFKVEGVYEDASKQAQQLIENEERYAERKNTQRQSTNYNNSGGKRYICKVMCRGSLWATGSEFTLETFASDRMTAKDQVMKRAEESTCKASIQGNDRAWWADVTNCTEG